ncbi:MAG: hypothetical protein WAK92_06935 [Thiobacillus sp.]|jgi:predicted PhzF superfamily epimerase YddE/YHI9
MQIRQYQVDNFSARAFEGNPAAVCSLEVWLDDRELIAQGAISFIERKLPSDHQA